MRSCRPRAKRAPIVARAAIWPNVSMSSSKRMSLQPAVLQGE